MSDLGRLMKFVEPVTESGCWIWTGCLMPHGYGQCRQNGKAMLAHRAMYLLVRGSLPPKGIDLDHLCRVRCCVNPDHLEPVTRQENLLRGAGSKLLGKDKCFRGHALAENLFFAGSKNTPRCRACDRERRAARPIDPEVSRARSREQYLKHRDERIAYQKEYQKANRDKINARSREYKRRRRAEARQVEQTQA